jgi:dolichol-phosphate mannosyltransferase
MQPKSEKLKIVHVIPTYNEKDTILLVLKGLDRIAAKYPKITWITLIVDDHSPDHTGQLVKNFKPRRMKISLLSGQKQGLGVAMRRGLDYAVRNLSPDIIITNEADLAYDFNLIPRAVSKIQQGWDVVLSSRHGSRGRVEGWTLNRQLNHFIANQFFAGWIAGVNHIEDHNGAFRAIRVRGILDRINWDKFPARGFAFFNYWTYILTTLTPKIYQLPIVYRFRTQGESKVSFNPKYFKTYARDVLEYIFLCLKIRGLILWHTLTGIL